MRHRARQHLLCRPDADQREGTRSRRNGPASIKVIFPTSGPTAATHVNISGMALAKYAPNHDNAVKLMEFLSSHEAQQIYAEKNFEYPVEPGPRAVRHREVVRRAEGGHLAAGRDRQQPQGRVARWSTGSASTTARAAEPIAIHDCRDRAAVRPAFRTRRLFRIWRRPAGCSVRRRAAAAVAAAVSALAGRARRLR